MMSRISGLLYKDWSMKATIGLYTNYDLLTTISIAICVNSYYFRSADPIDKRFASSPMTIEQLLNNFYQLPASSLELLVNEMQEVRFSKGHILLESDRLERKVYFLTKGLVRAYSPQPEQDITFWFGLEGDIVLSMRSYVEQVKSYEDVELMEDSILYGIGIEKLKSLYLRDIHIANLGRVIVEGELLKMEKRWISSQIKSAKERYDELVEESPALLQRVPLKYIASFLRMTPVSLSRIRKEK